MNSSVRREKWDNIKGALILLVILGHFTDYYTVESTDANALFLLIYSFHMPLFIFISGLFSKRCVNERDYKKIFPFLVLYFFIKFLNLIFGFENTAHLELKLFEDYHTPWYCLSLFFFYLITICLRTLDKKYVMLCSVVLACFAGYDTSIRDAFAISRTIVYYPFFYLGYCLKADDIEKLISNKACKIAGLIFLTGLAVYTYIFIDDIYWLRPLLTGRNPFKYLYELADYGGLIRFAYYPAVAFISLCFMSIIPEKCRFLSYFGKRSLQIYAIHNLIIRFMYKIGFQDLINFISPAYSTWLIIPSSVIVAAFCSLKIFQIPFNVIRNNGWSKASQK